MYLKLKAVPKRGDLSIVESKPEVNTLITTETFDCSDDLLFMLHLLPLLLLFLLVLLDHQRVLPDDFPNQLPTGHVLIFNTYF